MVNHYQDMWATRSETLTPLTELISKKKKIHWLPKHQQAFDDMKKIIAQEASLAFPNFKKSFHRHTKASDFQMGAVISQDNKRVAFWSKKLNPAQTRATNTEK